MAAHSLALPVDSTKVARRLVAIQKEVPLPYHKPLLSDIKQFSSKALPAEFDIYEDFLKEELRKRDMPEEFIYLPMSMTDMNVCYSKGERCGAWAMTPLVAIRYGLVVDSQHDERFSFEASTVAALDYLLELHGVFGDWWKCILAYMNSAPLLNNVSLRNPGHDIGLWEYYDKGLLPDTRSIGDFIASYYVFSSDMKKVAHSTEKYDAAPFSQPILVESLSTVTGLTEKRIHALNPVFRSNPMYPMEGYDLVLPKDAALLFMKDPSLVYVATESALHQAEEQKAAEELAAKQKLEKESASKAVTYTVKSGDMLGKIASRNHVTVSNLKKWNNLKGDTIRPGQVLIVAPAGSKSSQSAQASKGTSEETSKTTYKVKPGDTLSQIAEQHHVTVSQIKKWNRLKGDFIRDGQRLILYTK